MMIIFVSYPPNPFREQETKILNSRNTTSQQKMHHRPHCHFGLAGLMRCMIRIHFLGELQVPSYFSAPFYFSWIVANWIYVTLHSLIVNCIIFVPVIFFSDMLESCLYIYSIERWVLLCQSINLFSCDLSVVVCMTLNFLHGRFVETSNFKPKHGWSCEETKLFVILHWKQTSYLRVSKARIAWDWWNLISTTAGDSATQSLQYHTM